MEILRICDGKRGHENQSLGLVEALARLTSVQRLDLEVRGNSLLAALRLATRFQGHPQLVVGAGHATHLPILALARRARARSVVLMKPTLPMRLFDLCIVPQHDGVAAAAGTLRSLGALNRVRAAGSVEPGLTLVLIGGPSRHNDWDDDTLMGQLGQIQKGGRSTRMHLITSRRTPDATLDRLRSLVDETVSLVAFRDAREDWLATILPRAATVWVSEDSVSMAYEAASVDADVGLLEVPGLREGRTRRAVQALQDSGRAVSFKQWCAGRSLRRECSPLAEADRCARDILRRWPELS